MMINSNTFVIALLLVIIFLRHTHAQDTNPRADVVARSKDGKVTVTTKHLPDGLVSISVDGAETNAKSIDVSKPIISNREFKGRWLIMGCLTVSQDDIGAIIPTLDAVHSEKKAISMGIAGFTDYEQARHLIPPEHREFKNSETPIWIFMRDGKVVHFARGKLTKDELRELLGTAF